MGLLLGVLEPGNSDNPSYYLLYSERGAVTTCSRRTAIDSTVRRRRVCRRCLLSQLMNLQVALYHLLHDLLDLGESRLPLATRERRAAAHAVLAVRAVDLR